MTDKYFWTEHAKFKLRQYGLSEQRIKRVLRSPVRKEEGVAKNTVAVMQPVSSKRIDGKEVWKQEIWVMYEDSAKRKTQNANRELKTKNYKLQTIKIISVWRYPGVSPKRNPIPEDIWRELEGAGCE